MTNPYGYDHYYSTDKSVSIVLMSIIFLTILSFLAVALPFLVSEPITISKPIVADGSREAMSFNEMFSRSKYWG